MAKHFCCIVFLLCRQVSTEDGELKAKELGVLFIETSAKSSYNVKQVLTCEFKQVHKYFQVS